MMLTSIFSNFVEKWSLFAFARAVLTHEIFVFQKTLFVKIWKKFSLQNMSKNKFANPILTAGPSKLKFGKKKLLFPDI